MTISLVAWPKILQYLSGPSFKKKSISVEIWDVKESNIFKSKTFKGHVMNHLVAENHQDFRSFLTTWFICISIWMQRFSSNLHYLSYSLNFLYAFSQQFTPYLLTKFFFFFSIFLIWNLIKKKEPWKLLYLQQKSKGKGDTKCELLSHVRES